MSRSINTADEYDIVEHADTALSPQIVAEIREWLEPTDYLAESGEFRRHLLSQAPGTGLWICQTDEYRRWHDSPHHGSLWIKGVPGAGKSVAAASIIQHLRATEECPVLFFFFRNIIAANFSPRALIQDWLAQLLPHSPKLQFALQARLQTKLSETLDSDLIDLFLEGASTVPKLYCVADALDEMSHENRPFLDKLNSLATHRPRTLKLLMTSRPAQYLQSGLRDSSIVHISLQQRLVDVDITSYIGHRFDEAPKSEANQGRISRQSVVDMVTRQSEGLFLYAKLTMDQVDAALLSDDPVDLQALEASLPIGLEQTYDSMLAKQREKTGVSVDFQVSVLEAVTHASRPLRLNELASLMKCVYPDLDPSHGFKLLIAASCGALVEILEDETLQPIHHSFTEFLRGDTRTGSSSDFPVINSATAHKRLAIRCLLYLQSGSLLLEDEKSTIESDLTFSLPEHQRDWDQEHYKRQHLGIKEQKDHFDIRQARLVHPFLGYAVDNWSHHAALYDQHDKELFDAVEGFLDPEALSYRRWLVLRWGSTSKSKGTTEGYPTVLHIAAYAGLSEMTKVLIQKGASVSALDAQDRIPLHWAAAKGRAKAVTMLLEQGSAPNAEDARGLKPIHLAAINNHATVVTLLLEAGVQPNTIKTRENRGSRLLGGERLTRGECPILYVTEAGHLETIEAMIPYCKGAILEQLLCEALRYGRSAAALLVLNKSDVSPDAAYLGATALYHACLGAHADVVEVLVRKGADVRKTSEYKPRRRINGGGWDKETMTTPLHCLVKAWRRSRHDTSCQAILSLLVGAGCDLEQLDGRGNTPLLLACGARDNNYGNHRSPIPLAPVRALLSAGADPRATVNGDDALHFFLKRDHSLEGVKLLVSHGADVNSKDQDGEPVLHAAASNGYDVSGKEDTQATIEYLLEKNADPNARDKYGNTVLRKSMSVPPVFEKLLSRTDNEREIRRVWFGLESASMETFEQLLKMLLAKGMDIDAKNADWYGRTLYLTCISNDEKRKILLKYGAKSDAVGHHGNNALHQLASNNSTYPQAQMTKLIAEGLDPKAVNDEGSTLLHQVAVWYNWEPPHAEYVRWFLSLGIDVNAVDKKGRTVAHVLQLRSTPGSTVHGAIRHHMLDVIDKVQKLDLEIRDHDGLTPFHLAVIKGNESEVAKLAELGANAGCLTTDSQNSLHLACRARNPSLVAQLLYQTQGLDIDQKDNFGRTPLHYACASGEPDSVAFLIKHGARVDVVDSHHRTPLHACAEAGLERDLWAAESHRKSLRWLRGGPADPQRPTTFRRTHTRNSWYQYRTGPWEPKTDEKALPGIPAIIKMLIDAGVSITAINSPGGPVHTALDDAIQTGFGEFVGVFLENEELFQKATAHLEDDKEVVASADHIRQLIKAQMIMLQPQSRLDILRKERSHFESFVSSPLRGLGTLIPDDVAFLLNSCFEKDPESTAHYKNLLKKLMVSQHLQVIERANIVRHYSTFAAVRDHLDRQRKSGERYPDVPSLTALQMACQSERSNMATLRLLVENLHVDVNASCAVFSEYSKPTDELLPGGSALHLLASADSYWQVEALRYLIKHGADVNALDDKGRTPLHIAAAGHSYDNYNKSKHLWGLAAVKLLLDHGANPNVLDTRQESPLHKAFQAPEIVRELLKRGADASLEGRNPLFEAIYHQNLTTMEVLLDHGISVDSINDKSHSRNVHYSLTDSRKVYALLCTGYAAQINTSVKNSLPLLRCLIERGADLYAPLNDDELLLHFLFEFTEHLVPDTLLQEPCVSRIDFNRRDQHGRTVLMAACRFRDNLPGYSSMHRSPKAIGHPLRILDLAEKMSAEAADATLTDDEGKTALHHLLENPGTPDEVILEFIKHPAVRPTLQVKDAAGYTPLHCALRLLRPAVCEALLAAGVGANLAEPDREGRTALHHIAAGCMATTRRPRSGSCLSNELNEDFFDSSVTLWRRAVTEFGALINGRDIEGNTPLHAFLQSPCAEPRQAERRAQAQAQQLAQQQAAKGAAGGNVQQQVQQEDPCHLRAYRQLFGAEGSGVDISAVNNAGETMLHIVSKREVGYYTSKGHDKALFEALMQMGLDPLKEDAKGRSALDVASACEKTDIVALLGRK